MAPVRGPAARNVMMLPMRFSIWPGLSGQPWDDVLAVSQHAAGTGWDGIWIADHFMSNDSRRAARLECWSTLSALAAVLPPIRLGSLVAGNTYRHPAVLANSAATVAAISRGDVILGFGAGWQQNEHDAYGIELPPVPERLARFEEACAVVRALIDGGPDGTSDFNGTYYQLHDAPLRLHGKEPLRLMIGAAGEKVALRNVARYADEWNCWGTPDVLAHKISVLNAHCADLGRDPAQISRSAQVLLFVGDDAPGRKELANSGRPTIAGDVDHVRREMERYAEAGVDEFIVPDITTGPLDGRLAMLDLFIEKVAPAFR
jgi:alkanesulfonate monooxygenase SsuD/methylene tetrahydromethanopterin reductase-like flavin-dependent oxidoreductase (luciferase family)